MEIQSFMTEEYKYGRAHMFVIYATVKKEKRERDAVHVLHVLFQRDNIGTRCLYSPSLYCIFRNISTLGKKKNKYEPKKGQK